MSTNIYRCVCYWSYFVWCFYWNELPLEPVPIDSFTPLFDFVSEASGTVLVFLLRACGADAVHLPTVYAEHRTVC